MRSSAYEPAQMEMQNSKETWTDFLLWTGWGWTLLGHPVVLGAVQNPETATHNCAQAIYSCYAVMWKTKDYFHFACIYILPLTFLNSDFPEEAFLQRDQIYFFFHWLLWKHMWTFQFVQHLQWIKSAVEDKAL